MRLQELVEKKKGTYVGLRVLQPTVADIQEHCRKAGIPIGNGALERRLHTTVIYSRKHCDNLVIQPDVKHEASFICYEVFDNRSKTEKVLVVKLNAPSVYARHVELMAKHNAEYDYPVYIPHITLSNSYRGTLNDLLPISFPIFLGEEYYRELDE